MLRPALLAPRLRALRADDRRSRSATACFDDLGMVVEGIERVGEGLDGVVVAKVLEVDRIEGADKIQPRRRSTPATASRCRSCAGRGTSTPGDLVPLAPVGAVLPGDFEIGRRKMKGVESNGMLCSARELGLGDDARRDHGARRRGARPGTPLADALGIEPDVVFDLDINANRPDAMSMAGVARDLAAKLGLPFTLPDAGRPARRPVADAAVGRGRGARPVPALHRARCIDGRRRSGRRRSGCSAG